MAYDLDMPRSRFFSSDDEDEDFDARLLDDPRAQPAALAASLDIRPANNPETEVGLKLSGSDLDDSWQTAERRALAHSEFDPGEYGLGEFVRDTGAGAIASLLDVGFNKGRGLPQIAQGTAEIAANADAARQKRAQQQGDFALKARDAREGRDYKAAQSKHWDALDSLGGQRIGISGQNAETAAGREARIAEDAKRRHDTGTDEAGRKIDVLRQNGVPENMIVGRSSEELDKLLSIYSKQVDLANAPRTTAIAVDRAGKEADAKNQSELGYAGATAERREVGKAAGEIATAPAVREAKGEITDVEKAGEAGRAKFVKEAGDALQISNELNTILASPRNAEGSIPGLSRKETIASNVPFGESALSPEALKVQRSLSRAKEFFLRQKTGAAAAMGEKADNTIQVIGSATASAEQKENALKEFQAANDDYINTQAAVNPRAAQSVVDYKGGKQKIGPTRGPSPAIPSSGTVRMRSPTGKEYDVPPNKLKSAQAAKWTKVQ